MILSWSTNEIRERGSIIDRFIDRLNRDRSRVAMHNFSTLANYPSADWTVASLNRFPLSRTPYRESISSATCLSRIFQRTKPSTLYCEWREECYAAYNGCIKTHDTRDHLSSALSRRGCRNYQTKVLAYTTIPSLRRLVSDFLLFHMTECPPVTAWHWRSRYHPIVYPHVHALSFDIFSLIDWRLR